MLPDLIDDVAEFLLQAGIDNAVVDRVIITARRNWGGASHYIKRIDRRVRNTAIQKALASGASMSATARALKISLQTVKRNISR